MGLDFNFNNENSSKEKLDSIKNELKVILDGLKEETGKYVPSTTEKLLDQYINTHGRILYSEVTIYVLELKKAGNNEFPNFESNVDSCLYYFLENKDNIDEHVYKTVLKLWDHINLASNQYESFYQEESVLKDHLFPDLDNRLLDIKNNQEKISASSNDLKIRVQETIKSYDKIITDLISIVSIFVAISFVMFGGLSLIDSLFSSVDKIPIMDLICLGSLIGIIMVSCMYGFILFILRIIGKIEGNKKPYQQTYRYLMIGLTFVCIISFLICCMYEYIKI